MNVKDRVEAIIEPHKSGSVAVGFHDLKSGFEWMVYPDESFHAASTMKVCVLIELFHQADLGLVNLNDRVPVTNEFPSIVDGRFYSVDVKDDSEKTLYERIGETETLIELAVPMIVSSSNLATNILVEKLGATRITQFMRDLGASDLIIRRGVEDGKAFRLGLNNAVTARGFLTILVKLAKQEVVSAMASREMIKILLAQNHRNCIPAKLPAEVKVANKTGWNDQMCHDVAIIYPPDRSPYVLTVFTKGIEESVIAPNLISTISEIVYLSHA